MPDRRVSPLTTDNGNMKLLFRENGLEACVNLTPEPSWALRAEPKQGTIGPGRDDDSAVHQEVVLYLHGARFVLHTVRQSLGNDLHNRVRAEKIAGRLIEWILMVIKDPSPTMEHQVAVLAYNAEQAEDASSRK
jgi:hypothetical protein